MKKSGLVNLADSVMLSMVMTLLKTYKIWSCGEVKVIMHTSRQKNFSLAPWILLTICWNDCVEIVWVIATSFRIWKCFVWLYNRDECFDTSGWCKNVWWNHGNQNWVNMNGNELWLRLCNSSGKRTSDEWAVACGLTGARHYCDKYCALSITTRYQLNLILESQGYPQVPITSFPLSQNYSTIKQNAKSMSWAWSMLHSNIYCTMS